MPTAADEQIATRETLATVSTLGQLTKTDRRDVANLMLEAGIEKREGGYPIFLAIPALIERKEGIGKKASELNQEAQAKLNDVRRLALERKLVPIDEVRSMAAKLAQMTSKTIEDSELTMEAQNALMKSFAESIVSLFGEEVED